jgi:hypothetical protein
MGGGGTMTETQGWFLVVEVGILAVMALAGYFPRR